MPRSWALHPSFVLARQPSWSVAPVEDVADVLPVLRSFGTVRFVGPSGRAARLKLVANSMLADVILAAAELQVAGEDAGLDPDDVFFVLNRVAPSLVARQAGLEGHRTATLFALRDLAKDVDLAMVLFDASATKAPLTRWSRERVDEAAAATPDLDISAVAQLYRQGVSGVDPATATPVAVQAR